VLSTPEQKGWGGCAILTCFARNHAGFVWAGVRAYRILWLRLHAGNLITGLRCEPNAGPSTASLAMRLPETSLRMTRFLKSIRSEQRSSCQWLGSGEGDGGVVEVLAEEALGEGFEVFAGLGECEGVGGFGPL
jgi:hypothetical protein